MKLHEVAVSGIRTAWTGQLILAAPMAPGCGPLTPMRGSNSPARGAAPPHDHDHSWNISPCARAPFSALVTARKGCVAVARIHHRRACDGRRGGAMTSPARPALLYVTDLQYQAWGRRYGDEDTYLSGQLRDEFVVGLCHPLDAVALMDRFDAVVVRNTGPVLGFPAGYDAFRAAAL